MSKLQKNIVWFKRDLRLGDHAPLVAAVRSGSVLPLYIIEPELWNQPDSSRRHWHFIHDCLLELNEQFMNYGGSLCLRVGDVVDVLSDLNNELGDFDLYSHEETGNNWTFKRDKRVKLWCHQNSVSWHEFPTNGIVRKLKTRNDWARFRDKRMGNIPIERPSSMDFVEGPKSQSLTSKQDELFGKLDIGTVQAGGRTEGLKVLDSFLKERSKRYILTISKPGISARHCSRLSAHISFGTLSIREIEKVVYSKLNSLSREPDTDAVFFKRNLRAFLSRLAWHCHFVQKLEQQPDLEFKCMHQAFEGMREPHFRDDFLKAWQQGITGYPLIDACMRSLHENGWITFRMRALLVSFASYHLWLDWRQTAPFLAQLFTDYEPGIHYSQFQMQSGVTGINAVRMYNPIKQSYEHDATGKFIRRYVPELRNLPDTFIHEPWRFEGSMSDYPNVIVDHQTATRFARNEIKKVRMSDGFKEQSKIVNEHLGSRKRQPKRRGQIKQKKSDQLSLDL